MPYITFSRNLEGQRKLLKSVKSTARDSLVELRGNKSVKRIAELASQNGFKKAIIISKEKESGKFFTSEISIKRKGNSLVWKYGKTKTIKL